MKKLFLFLALLFSTPVYATTYWVSATGGSTGSVCADIDGAADPNVYFRTINAGVACLAAGDTLKVKATGTYDEHMSNNIPAGVSTSTRTIVTGDRAGSRPLIQPTTTGIVFSLGTNKKNIQIEYFDINLSSNPSNNSGGRCVGGTGTGANDVVVQDIKCTGYNYTGTSSGAAGISDGGGNVRWLIRNNEIGGFTCSQCVTGSNILYIKDSDHIVEHNYLHDNDGYGIQIYNTSGTRARNIIRYNYFKNNGSAQEGNGGITICSLGTSGSCVDTVVHNNIFDSNRNGITINGTRTLIFNNTVYNSTLVGITYQSGTCTLANNISLGNGSANTSGTSSCTNTTNRFTGTATDFMIDPAGANFSLKESSAAIDAGTAQSATGAWTGHSGLFVGSTPDQGAMEAPIRLGAVIENATPTVYSITFSMPSQSIRNGVGLQSCTTANWAIRDDGAGMTENACNIIGTSQVNVGMDASMTAGVADDAYTRGTLTDNFAVGDPNSTFKNNSIRTYSATAGTNNVGGGAATLTSLHYRCLSWYADTSPSTTDWLRAEDASNSTLRCPIRAGGLGAVAVSLKSSAIVSQAFEWHRNRNGGAYAAMTNTCSATTLCFANTAAPVMADGEAISSAILTSASYLAGLVVAQQATQPVINFTANTDTNVILLVKTDAAAAVGDAFCIQAAPAGGAVAGVAQTQFPCFEVVSPASGF